MIKFLSSNHRLKCPSYPIKQLRIFSIENHEIYYRNGPFDVEKYIEDIKTANNNIKNLRKLEINQVSDEMRDNYEPQKITLDNTLTWIRNKFELTMYMKRVDFIAEGIEYKLFEDLTFDKEGKKFTPAHSVR